MESGFLLRLAKLKERNENDDAKNLMESTESDKPR